MRCLYALVQLRSHVSPDTLEDRSKHIADASANLVMDVCAPSQHRVQITADNINPDSFQYKLVVMPDRFTLRQTGYFHAEATIFIVQQDSSMARWLDAIDSA